MAKDRKQPRAPRPRAAAGAAPPLPAVDTPPAVIAAPLAEPDLVPDVAKAANPAEAASLAVADAQAEPTPALATDAETVVAATSAVLTDAAPAAAVDSVDRAEQMPASELTSLDPTSPIEAAAPPKLGATPEPVSPSDSAFPIIGSEVVAESVPPPIDIRATAAPTLPALSEIGEKARNSLTSSYAVAVMGMAELNAKAVGDLHANSVSALQFVESLMGAKSLSEAIRLQTEHARRQFEVVSSQAKQLTALARRVVNDTAHPPKSHTGAPDKKR